jgi:hypothetical protein
MGEADLMAALGPAHLRRQTVGDRELRAVLAEERRHNVLAAARPDHEAGVVGVVEDPGPPSLLADPYAGLVRLEDRAGEQALADEARLPREGPPAALEHGDERAFADRDATEIGHEPRQALERDCVRVVQIEDEGDEVGPERRARLQSRRRRRREAPRAARAVAAMQCHPRHVGLDLGQLDEARRAEDRHQEKQLRG